MQWRSPTGRSSSCVIGLTDRSAPSIRWARTGMIAGAPVARLTRSWTRRTSPRRTCSRGLVASSTSARAGSSVCMTWWPPPSVRALRADLDSGLSALLVVEAGVVLRQKISTVVTAIRGPDDAFYYRLHSPAVLIEFEHLPRSEEHTS